MSTRKKDFLTDNLKYVLILAFLAWLTYSSSAVQAIIIGY